jgi:hypothetical protein
LRPPEAAVNAASGLEPEVLQHGLDAGVHLPRVGRVELVVQPVELTERRVGMVGRHAHARRVVARQQPPRLAEPRRHDVEGRARDVRRDVLLEAGDRRAALAHHVAGVGGTRAVEQLHQGALACAVAPEQAHALPALDSEGGAVEHRRAAESDGDVLQSEKGHAGS